MLIKCGIPYADEYSCKSKLMRKMRKCYSAFKLAVLCGYEY